MTNDDIKKTVYSEDGLRIESGDERLWGGPQLDIFHDGLFVCSIMGKMLDYDVPGTKITFPPDPEDVY